ncbi:MAG: biotin carboxylase [Ruminococcaceae bacterium]|nr:biotin carboxylase [Oscillospiraceae bacterium]
MNNDTNIQKIPKRVLNSLLLSVSAGVVPRMGAPYIAIGRKDEISALLSDLEQINEGCGTMRFIIGRYGSGKSFLMQLIRGYALERDFLTADADLSPERRLYGSSGTGVATYRELIKNLASKSSPDGNALPKIIARWIEMLKTEVIASGVEAESDEFIRRLNIVAAEKLREVEYMVGGFDFARVITEYYRAYIEGNDDKKSACLRWLRGEYATKTEARSALGFSVSVIIDDDNWYDFIKLLAVLVRFMGYRGLVVFIDECVNLYKITHRVSRENNYEKILSMFNDTLQGRASGLALILGGTPQFMDDTRRGLFSYEALRSRLCDSRFASEEYRNLVGPVIRLKRLTDEELFALISRVTKLYAANYGKEPRITEEQMMRFLELSLSRAGADQMITPREMLRDYMTVLNILMQNDNIVFEDVVNKAFGEALPSEEKDGSPEKAQEPKRNNYTANDIEF